MTSTLTKMYPKVYILSQIPQLHQYVKNIVPDGVIVSSLNLLPNDEKKVILDPQQKLFFKDVEICLGEPQLLSEVYEQFPNMKWIQSTWAGVEPLLSAIEKQQIVPTFTLTRFASDNFSSLMAEYVICQIINWERSIHVYWKCQAMQTWSDAQNFRQVRALSELTVSILGVGSMGCGVAKCLKTWGTKIIGFSKNPRLPGAKEYDFFHSISTDIKEVLADCDYLINLLPGTSETSGLLNGTVLKYCLKKPVFMNVGRGSIIKKQHIIKAIRNHWISGAILDVFEEEPLPRTSELWKMSEVFITPHISAVSTPKQVAEAFVRNYKKYIASEKLENVVSFTAGY